MLRRLSRNISESHRLAALQLMHVDNLHGRAYDVTSLTLGRDPQGGPLLCICSSHFVTVLLFLLYYSLTITQCVTVCHSPQSSWCASVLQALRLFSGRERVHWMLQGRMDGWMVLKLKKKKTQTNKTFLVILTFEQQWNFVSNIFHCGSKQCDSNTNLFD